MVYHEQQRSRLCGQHALNALLQGKFFDAESLSYIASHIDRVENRLAKLAVEATQNGSDGQDFSIQVLNQALRPYSISLEPCTEQKLLQILADQQWTR